MPRISLLVGALATTAAAQPAPNPTASLDAKVIAIGKAPGLLCGVVMATQDVTLEVTKVQRGAVKAKSNLTVRVMTCFKGPLLRVLEQGPAVELDPDALRVGSLVHVDLEQTGKDAWFATTDKITVTKR